MFNNNNNHFKTVRSYLPACHATCIPTPSIPAPFVFERTPFWGDSFFLRGRAGLDKRANMNGRGILRRMGRASLCPPLELARALQEEEGGDRGGVGGTRLKGNMPGEFLSESATPK